jgi:hypothetical protein
MARSRKQDAWADVHSEYPPLHIPNLLTLREASEKQDEAEIQSLVYLRRYLRARSAPAIAKSQVVDQGSLFGLIEMQRYSCTGKFQTQAHSSFRPSRGCRDRQDG